ncbi:MAG: sulfotransferase, partial [Xanthomonadales bacterium]|nr:sulfotransferase [Xanthomonadales bacterium]
MPVSGDDMAAQGELQRIQDLMRKDNPTDAVWACDRFNRDHPGSAAGWNLASQLALRIGDPTSALRAMSRALNIEPDQLEWLLQKARCLLVLGRREEARSLAQKMSNRLFPSAGLSMAAGLLMSSLDMYEQAERLFLDAVKLEPGVAGYYYNLATVQRFLGKLDKAEVNLDKTLALNPGNAEAVALRSGLRRQTPERNHLEELRGLLADSAKSPRQVVSTCYALAKELEDIGDYSRSFTYLKKGADTRREHLHYDVQRDIQTMSTIRDVYSEAVFTDGNVGFINASPIFVIGMPRTGTTLVERILGSHSAVRPAGELNDFALSLVKITGGLAGKQPVSGANLVTLSKNIDFASLGRLYIESARDRMTQCVHFVDKMPMNFLYAGLIHLALPKAKIIHVERNPMDTCYAVYKTLFENAYPYSYDLPELGQYYVAYKELMAHWGRVMPGVMHTVNYEDLVTDHRAVAESMLEYCKLSWEEQCFRPHEIGGYSSTASAAQVRMPVHQESIGRWKHYRNELQPLA